MPALGCQRAGNFPLPRSQSSLAGRSALPQWDRTMASSRIPGPVCLSSSPPLDLGTLMRWWSAPPGPVCLPPPPRQWHNYSRAGGFSASSLTMSPQAVTLLQGIEKLRLSPYDDQPGKATAVWVAGATIGYGHLIASTLGPPTRTASPRRRPTRSFAPTPHPSSAPRAMRSPWASSNASVTRW